VSVSPLSVRASQWVAGLLAALFAGAVAAAPTCDRLVDSGVRDCNLRLSLDTVELLDQDTVVLNPAQLDVAKRSRPLSELAPTPEQFGQIQVYCRRHGEIRREIGLSQGLCSD